MMKVTTGEKHDRQLSKWITLGVASSVLFLASQANQAVPAKSAAADSSSSSETVSQAQDTMPVSGTDFNKSGDAFTASNNNWTQVSTNANDTILATHVTTDNGHVTYASDSQFVLLFNSSEDLKDGSFTINTREGNGTDYDAGNFQTITIDGQSYYGIYLDSSMVKDVLQHNVQGRLSELNIKNGPTGVSTTINLDFYEKLTVNLPELDVNSSGEDAADFLVGQTVTVSDELGDNDIVSLNLTAADVDVKDSSSSTGSYQYTLTPAGQQRIADELSKDNVQNPTIDYGVSNFVNLNMTSSSSSNSSQSSAAGNSDSSSTETSSADATSTSSTTDSGTASSSDSSQSSDDSSTTSSGNETGTTGTDSSTSGSESLISNTVKYVNEYGSTVGTTTIKGQADTEDTLDVSATLPQGYVVADGQNSRVQYTFTPDGTLTIQVKQAPAILVSGTVTYVDQYGNTVGTPKELTATASSMHIYTVAVPAGYTLASDQRISVPYLWTNADSSQNTLTIHLVKLDSVQDYGTTTVNYVDADTGKVLQSEKLTGAAGTRVTFDTSTIVSQFLQQGYVVEDNETLGTAYYTTAGQTLTVTLKKPASSSTIGSNTPPVSGTTTVATTTDPTNTSKPTASGKSAPKLAGRVVLPSTIKQPASKTATQSGNNSTTHVSSATPSSNNGTSTTPMNNASTGTSSTDGTSLPSASVAFVTLTDNATPSASDTVTPSTAKTTPQTTADAQNTGTNETPSAQQAAAQKAAEAATTQQRQITAARKAAAAKRAAHERVQREALKQFEDANERDQFQHQSVAFTGSSHSHHHGDGGPAGGGDSFTELAKYFSVLSGKINFGR